MIRRLALVSAAALGLALAGWSFHSPRLHVRDMKLAAEAKDSARLRELIDFEAVRASLRDDVRAMLLASAPRELTGNPLAGLGLLVANALIEPMVDALVSPQSIVLMMERGTVRQPGAPAPSRPPPTPEKDSRESSAVVRQDIVVEHGYESLNRYRYAIRPAGEPPDGSLTLHLRREGPFSWKLDRIGLPQALLGARR